MIKFSSQTILFFKSFTKFCDAVYTDGKYAKRMRAFFLRADIFTSCILNWIITVHTGPFVSYLPTVYNFTTFLEFLYYFSNLNVVLTFRLKAQSLRGVNS